MTRTVFYLDTCIWRDFYESRFSKGGAPLGGYASSLFMNIMKKKGIVLFSDALIRELGIDYDEKEINDMLGVLFANNALVRLNIAKEEHLEAKKLSCERNLPYIDCLIAVQARNNSAVLVTQDSHFFEKLSDITRPVRPQEVI